MFKGHPKGLLAAALSNMGERFGYYIMNAVLVLFLCSKFGLSEETSSLIYSFFYAGIYILALVGGYIADKTQNYKGTIMAGLMVMATGYVLLSIPILATSGNISWLLPLTCLALFIIAFGNGLFKGNLQAIVGQMYDNLEAEAAKQGEEALKAAKDKRDSGFQIFYVFINIGGVIAPFVAPLLREWWLKAHDMLYNAQLPALCHQFQETGELNDKLILLASDSSLQPVNDMATFCSDYLQIFNEGIHYSFIASVTAMLISLTIFIATRKRFPTPAKKAAATNVDYTPEERIAAAKEIKPVSFVFIKATEGISLKDRHFTKNWKNADETGIRKGAYHFFRSSKDPSGQADNFIKTVGDISSDDLPPVLDIETIHKGCSKEELNRRALIWLKKIEQHYGRKPIVYSPASFINDILSEEIKENYPIWVAHYRSDRPDAEKWDLWQCTDKGVIYGIKGMTDISVCTTDALRAL